MAEWGASLIGAPTPQPAIHHPATKTQPVDAVIAAAKANGNVITTAHVEQIVQIMMGEFKEDTKPGKSHQAEAIRVLTRISTISGKEFQEELQAKLEKHPGMTVAPIPESVMNTIHQLAITALSAAGAHQGKAQYAPRPIQVDYTPPPLATPTIAPQTTQTTTVHHSASVTHAKTHYAVEVMDQPTTVGFQTLLAKAGIPCGTFGPKKDGVDGIPGEKTQASMEFAANAAGVKLEDVLKNTKGEAAQKLTKYLEDAAIYRQKENTRHGVSEQTTVETPQSPAAPGAVEKLATHTVQTAVMTALGPVGSAITAAKNGAELFKQVTDFAQDNAAQTGMQGAANALHHTTVGQNLEIKAVEKAAETLAQHAGPKFALLGAKAIAGKIPVAGAVVALGFAAWDIGSTAIDVAQGEAHWQKLASVTASSVVSVVGGAVGFGLGEVGQEAVHHASKFAFGAKNSSEQSATVQLATLAIDAGTKYVNPEGQAEQKPRVAIATAKEAHPPVKQGTVVPGTDKESPLVSTVVAVAKAHVAPLQTAVKAGMDVVHGKQTVGQAVAAVADTVAHSTTKAAAALGMEKALVEAKTVAAAGMSMLKSGMSFFSGDDHKPAPTMVAAAAGHKQAQAAGRTA